MAPLGEVGAGVGRAVLPEEEHRDRVHLEVEVRRHPAGVAGVAHEADHLPRPDVGAVRRERRERREVRVEERVPLPVAEPQPVAGGVVPADGVERAGRRRPRAAGRGRRRCRCRAASSSPAGPSRTGRRRGRPVDREDVRPRRQLPARASCGTPPTSGAVDRRQEARVVRGCGPASGTAGGAVCRRRCGVADLDLAACGQAAVRGGQVHVERDRDPVVALAPALGRSFAVVGRDDEVAPVAERRPPEGMRTAERLERARPRCR